MPINLGRCHGSCGIGGPNPSRDLQCHQSKTQAKASYGRLSRWYDGFAGWSEKRDGHEMTGFDPNADPRRALRCKPRAGRFAASLDALVTPRGLCRWHRGGAAIVLPLVVAAS